MQAVFRFAADPKRWTGVTAPVAPSPRLTPACLIRCVAITRWMIRNAGVSSSGRTAKRLRSGDFRNVRVAWSRDPGGLPVDPRVGAALEGSRMALESPGCVVEEAHPDLTGAREDFAERKSPALRGFFVAQSSGAQ